MLRRFHDTAAASRDQALPGAPIESYKAVWKIADEARFDHCWGMDHLATIGTIGDDRPVFDGWVGLFSEGLQVIKSLWTEERTNFDGRYDKMRNAVANPKPMQQPYPPIWIGSGGPNMLKLAARHADVCNATGTGGQIESAAAGSQQLDEAWQGYRP